MQQRINKGKPLLSPHPSIPYSHSSPAQHTRKIIGDDAAMRSGGDMKSFFRQQKAHTSAATKPTGGVSKKTAAAAAAAAAVHLHASTLDHGDDADARRRRQEEEDRERAAREFDMDMRYGPCLGLTRAQRWRRAAALGLAPPPALCSDAQPCLWEGRV